MGVSIHYKGRIANQSRLPRLVEELEEIARAHQWKYQVYNREFPMNSTSNDELFGIMIQPTGCEPVNFTFLANGRLCGVANLVCWGKETKSPYAEYLYMNSTKTQFAGAEVHRLIIGMFRYISNRYLADFELIDEGQYWETDDYDLLKKNLNFIDDMLDGIQLAFSAIPSEEGERIEDYIARMAQRVRDRAKE